jgi:hypothetical protein
VCVMCDAVRRNTSGTMPKSFECDWNLLLTQRVTAVLACFQVSPSIVHCCRVFIVLMCDFMIHSWISDGTVSSGEHGTIIVERGRNRLFHRNFWRFP